MIADVDDDGSNEIDFGEFCKVIAKQKTDKAGESDESDTSARRLLAPLLLPAAAAGGCWCQENSPDALASTFPPPTHPRACTASPRS